MAEYKTTLQRQQDRLLDYVNTFVLEVQELRDLVAAGMLTDEAAVDVMDRFDRERSEL